MEKFLWIALAHGLLLGAVVAAPAAAVAANEVTIVVDHGYTPDEIHVRAGEPVRLRFVRKDRSGCTREVVFPSLGIRRELPPHEQVVIDLGPQPAGRIELHCGMQMVRGVIVVR
jgi:plastocyanin domain-containing protein